MLAMLSRCMVLHVMRNTVPKDNNLFLRGMDALRSRLPAGWSAVAKRAKVASLNRAAEYSFVVRGPDGRRADVQGVVLGRPTSREIIALASATTARGPSLVFAEYLSPTAQERLRASEIGFLDLTGNARFSLRRPGLMIDATGAATEPEREDRPARTLKGPRIGRIVRALCDFAVPIGVRRLAEAADVDPGYVSRALVLLEQEALVDRGARGSVERVAVAGLIRRWAADTTSSFQRRSGRYLDPRGIPAFFDKLRAAGIRHAVTGSAAAMLLAPVAPVRLAAVYVDDPDGVAAALGLKAAEAGSNVLLIEPADPVVFERTHVRDGLTYVAASQLAADLLASPGRGDAEAEAVIERAASMTRAYDG